jgi:hypothetical protein
MRACLVKGRTCYVQLSWVSVFGAVVFRLFRALLVLKPGEPFFIHYGDGGVSEIEMITTSTATAHRTAVAHHHIAKGVLSGLQRVA